MIKSLKIYFIAILLLSFSVSVAALKTDQDKPIDIQADHLEMNEAQQISIYKGNVILNQGSLTIKADTLTLHFDTDNELDYMEMTGSPAQLKQLNAQQQWMTSSAEHIEYRDKKSQLTLTKSAQFNSGKEHIKSHYILINTESEHIKAGKNDAANRVHITILPRHK